MQKVITKVKSIMNKNSLLLKILTSYIIIGTVLLSSLSMLIYNQFLKSSLSEIEDITQKMLFQSRKMTETFWMSNFGYMFQEYLSDKVLTNAMYSSNFEDTEYGDISQRLTSIANTSSFVHSVYIYNSDAGLVFSNFSTFTPLNEFFDVDFINSLNKYTGSENPLLVNRKIKFKGQIDENVISLVFMQKNNNGVLAAMVYNLNQTFFQSVVTSEKLYDTSTIIIVDNKGSIISHPDLDAVNTNISDKAYFKKIYEATGEGGSFIDEVNGKKSLVAFVKWDKLGWNFININNYNKLQFEIKQAQRNILNLLVAFILINILIALLFAGNIYIPIYRLVLKIRKGNEIHGRQDVGELDLIAKEYDSLVNNVNKYRTLANSSIDTVKKDVLKQTLSGYFSKVPDIMKAFELINLEFKADYFNVIVMKIDGFYAFSEKYRLDDVKICKSAICNIAEEIFNSRHRTEVLEIEEDTICALVNFDKTENWMKGMIESVHSVQEAVDKYLTISISVGIGTAVNNIGQVSYAYKNAVDACSNRIVLGTGAVVACEEQKSRAEYFYPLELEKKLLDTLKTGDESKLITVVDEFIQVISSFSYNEIMLSFTQLILMILRTFKRTNYHMDNKQLDLNFKSLNEILSRYDTLIQMKEWFLSICSLIIADVKDEKDKKYEELVNKIKRYIDENYYDAGLSIEKLSDMVQLSPNYVRAIFKENVGKSVSNYISDYRLEKAKELLIKTEFTVSKISEMTGYGSNIYFNSAFKKMIGKTPEEYRRESINKINNILYL